MSGKRMAMAVMSLALAGAAAEVGRAQGQTGDQAAEARRMRVERQILPGLARLDLTEIQKAQIEAVMQAGRDGLTAAVDAARSAREALNNLMQAGPFDEASVRAACKKAAAAEEESAVLRAALRGKVRALLTPDQLAKADAARADGLRRGGVRARGRGAE